MESRQHIEAPTGRQVVTVLLASGAIGFFLGVVRDPAAPDALEPAQVLAGVVQYLPQSPVYIYSTQTWTVLHQVLALLLHWGFSERTLALVVSGVIGMVSLQALAVFVLALSRDAWLAVISPFFIYFTEATSGGVTYPVLLMGAPFTYGILGLSYMVLTFALIGAGHVRWAAMLLGFGPAIHPTIGAWAIIIVTIAAVIAPRWARDSATPVLPYFVAGAAASALSAVIHYLSMDHTAPALYLSFVHHWDSHRQPFFLVSGSMAAVCLSTGLAVLWMSRFRHEIPAPARELLRILVITAVLGTTLSLSYWLIPGTVPSVIPALMPSRLLNVGLFTCTALVIGVSARYTSSVWIQLNLAALVLVALILCLSPGVADEVRSRSARVATGVSGLTLALLTELRRRGVGTSEARPWLLAWVRRGPWLAAASVLVATGAFALRDFDRTVSAVLQDRTSDPLLAATARRPGLLLTAGDLHQIQLQTRRPVLLDGGALDALLYVPQAAPETDRILRRVYGIDLLGLQRAHANTLATDQAKALWEARTSGEWRALAREFGVTDVLTYPAWTLQLPVIASSAQLVLYEIPLGH